MVTKKNPPKKRYDTDFLILFTGYSKRLIKGRKGDVKNNVYPIYGFDKFTRKVRLIWNAAELDNPYALWFLKRISDKLNITEKLMDKREKEAKARFDDGLEIDYRLFNGTEEDKYPLNLKPPYSWALARLIKRYDDYCLILLKQNSIGLIKDRAMQSSIEEMSKLILHAINEAISYYDLKIMATDIENGTDAYEKAAEHMGIIPPNVLSGKLKADFLPKVKKVT